MASLISSPYISATFGESRAVSTAFGREGTTVTRSEGMDSHQQGSQQLPVLSTRNDAYFRDKAYTPFDDLDLSEQFTERPDISIYCKECDRHIDLRLLSEHKYYHSALEIMKYKPNTRPASVAMLIRRRRGIVRRMKKECTPDKPLDADYVQKVNDAYEFLKADLEDTYESYRRIVEKPNTEVDGIGLNCTAQCATAVGISSSGNERWKNGMEDTRVFQDCFGNDPRKCFFAIYDGHQGRFAAEIASQELHHALLDSMSRFDPRTKCTCTFNMGEEYNASEHDTHSRATSRFTERGELLEESAHAIQQIINNCEDKMAAFEASQNEDEVSLAKSQKTKKSSNKDPFSEKMGQAFIKSHKYTDFLLSWGREENSKVRWSGCSTLTCVLQETPPKEGEDNKENEVNKPEKKGPPPLKQLGILHLANAGNVCAVLVRGNVPYRLSREHTPSNNKEKNRILKQGGDISESEKQMRVNGVLATTRGLGNHGDPELKKCVSVEPYTTSVPIDQYAQFLILASHGVWEVLSEQQAADLCLQVLPQHRLPPSSNMLSASALRLNETPEAEDLPEEPVLDDASSVADAIQGERKKQKKPRASTARSRVSFVDEKEMEKGGGLHQKVGMEAGDGNIHEKHSKKRKSVSKKKTFENQLEVHADMQTEAGSHMGDDDYSDEFDDDDDGHLGDVDTCTEVTSGRQTALDRQTPTPEQIQRDFARGMAERLVQSALLAGSRDNITVMIVLLPGCGV